MANLDILEGEELVKRVATPGAGARYTRSGRLATAPGVGEIRTVGLTAAVAFRRLTCWPPIPACPNGSVTAA